MNVVLYVSREGLFSPKGEKLVASPIQNEYYAFQIIVDHTYIVGKVEQTSKLVNVIIPKSLSFYELWNEEDKNKEE